MHVQVANMSEMQKSEAKKSEVNHRFVEHGQWYDTCFSDPVVDCPGIFIATYMHTCLICLWSDDAQ